MLLEGREGAHRLLGQLPAVEAAAAVWLWCRDTDIDSLVLFWVEECKWFGTSSRLSCKYLYQSVLFNILNYPLQL